jgi:hypothetical protein
MRKILMPFPQGNASIELSRIYGKRLPRGENIHHMAAFFHVQKGSSLRLAHRAGGTRLSKNTQIQKVSPTGEHKN